MPPRTSANLIKYKRGCKKVMERADNCCEVMLDEKGRACSNLVKIRRCAKVILPEEAAYINFLHTDTRSGKSSDWVNDPDNITFGCAEHHIEEENIGPNRVERCDYSELSYIPEL